MKNLFLTAFIAVLLFALASCSSKKGGDPYPKDNKSNEAQISGTVISEPLDYDGRLGFKLAIDQNGDGLFSDDTEKYGWMPNDMYHEVVLYKKSITIKAVRFCSLHGLFPNCDEYIIFDWKGAVAVADSNKK